MNCKEIKKLSNLMLDSGISEEQRVILEEHLNSCLSCKQEYDELVSLKNFIETSYSDVEIPRMSDDFDSRLQERLSMDTTLIARIRGIFSIPAIRLSSVSAIGLAVVILSALLIPRQRPESINASAGTAQLLMYAVQETSDMYEVNLVNEQTKEILHNFL
ncbi:anti-sigma factor family protein [Elusimicrobiota bacterium]